MDFIAHIKAKQELKRKEIQAKRTETTQRNKAERERLASMTEEQKREEQTRQQEEAEKQYELRKQEEKLKRQENARKSLETRRRREAEHAQNEINANILAAGGGSLLPLLSPSEKRKEARIQRKEFVRRQAEALKGSAETVAAKAAKKEAIKLGRRKYATEPEVREARLAGAKKGGATTGEQRKYETEEERTKARQETQKGYETRMKADPEAYEERKRKQNEAARRRRAEKKLSAETK